MENEYQILTHLQDNEETSQRKISQRTGLSLGAVNILIKKMVRKGLIKVEQLNSRTMRYILTPQGMKEKTRLTYIYVRNAYLQIMSITNAVEELIEAERVSRDYSQTVLYGPADEVEQILKNALSNLNITPVIKRPEDGHYIPGKSQLVLTWRTEDEENIVENSNRSFNIMKIV